MEQLTGEDYKNILALIARSTLKGEEATTVAILQQKISNLLNPEPKEVVGEEVKDEKNKNGYSSSKLRQHLK